MSNSLTAFHVGNKIVSMSILFEKKRIGDHKGYFNNLLHLDYLTVWSFKNDQ